MLEKPRIAVLIAAHNRRDLTLRALQTLRDQEDCFTLQLVLFDDGSTDETASAVEAYWPDAVILHGDGSAYWNGGMHAAWQHALKLQPDGYLWLNDDVRLDNDALSRLAAIWHDMGGADKAFIAVGATRDEGGLLSYGGQRRVASPFSLKFAKLPISQSCQKADTFNGNIVLISRETVARIGVNDPSYMHSLGDIDYGLRATNAGIDVVVAPYTFGICNPNSPFSIDGHTLMERWKKFTSFRGLPVKNWARITKKFSGIWFPIHFLGPYRKVFFPDCHRRL